MFSLNGIDYEDNSAFTGLSGGTYEISVKDANDCITIQIVIIAVSNGPGPEEIIIQDAICNLDNGSINISASGGQSPYKYSLNGIDFQDANIFNNLAADTYTVSIKDANDCIFNQTAIILQMGNPVFTGVSTIPTSCGLDNGSIIVEASEGTTPYLYSLDGINFYNDNSFTNLAGGNYTITIKDANDCIVNKNITIDDTDSPVIEDIQINDAICGNDNGSIGILINGGTSPYQYSINGTDFIENNTFNDLAEGEYTIYIKDAIGCETNQNLSIIQTGSPIIEDIQLIDAICGKDNGSININVTNGMPPYQYSINGTDFLDSNIFSDLAGGDYTILIKDVNGCETLQELTINQKGSPNIDDIQITDAICGDANGSININISSGIPPYQYSINGIDFINNGLFTNLAAGDYTVYIKDDNDCEISHTVSITAIAGPILEILEVKEANCDLAIGSISVTATNGTSPYLYNINGENYTSNSTFINLSGGSYEISTKDANDCIFTTNVIVPVSDGPTIDNILITDAQCDMNNGSLNILASGGQSPYEYSLNGIDYSSQNTFNDLAEGSYTITVKDANNCEITQTVEINQISGPVIDNIPTTHTTCGQANGSINISVSGGTPPYQFSINGGADFYDDNIFNGLNGGEYDIIVVDANNCSTNQNININESDVPSIDDIITNDALCGEAKGSINISVSGGTPPYQFSINGGADFYDDNIFNGLNGGEYDIIVVDANNCSTNQNININESDTPSIDDIITNDALCGQANGSINISVSGGTPPYQFSINGGADFYDDNIFNGLNGGEYDIIVVDNLGCEIIQRVKVDNYNENCSILIPTAFSPNNDGINDYFEILSQDKDIIVSEYLIYNRWGNEVYRQSNMSIQNIDWWNGQNNSGHHQLKGVYVYWIVIEKDGQKETFKGNITLIR